MIEFWRMNWKYRRHATTQFEVKNVGYQSVAYQVDLHWLGVWQNEKFPISGKRSVPYEVMVI